MAEVKYPESGNAYRAARDGARVGGSRVTQERLAEAVGVNPRTIKRIERGDNRPWPKLRDEIASYLGVDPATLPSASEDPFVSSETGSLRLSPRGFFQKFAELFRRR